MVSISLKSSIAESIVEGDDTYSLHRAGVGVCSNELEDAAFVSSKNFMQGLVPREETMHYNDKFELSWTCSVASAEVWYRKQLCSING